MDRGKYVKQFDQGPLGTSEVTNNHTLYIIHHMHINILIDTHTYTQTQRHISYPECEDTRRWDIILDDAVDGSEQWVVGLPVPCTQDLCVYACVCVCVRACVCVCVCMCVRMCVLLYPHPKSFIRGGVVTFVRYQHFVSKSCKLLRSIARFAQKMQTSLLYRSFCTKDLASA